MGLLGLLQRLRLLFHKQKKMGEVSNMIMINRRRVMGNENGLFPSEYKQLEYIKSTGAQYFDTGVPGGANDLEIGCRFRYTKYAMYGAVYGNWRDDTCNTTRLIVYITNFVLLNNNRLSSDGGCTDISIIENTIHTVISQYTIYTVDGVTGTVTHTALGTANNDNIALFNRSVTNPNTSRDIGLEVYSFYIKKSGTLIRNLIPCRRKSDNAVGMYDLVNDTFYTNIGTGDFIAGPEV